MCDLAFPNLAAVEYNLHYLKHVLLLRHVHSPSQVKLQQRDSLLSEHQAQILDLHTELSQLQRMLQAGPPESSMVSFASSPHHKGACCAGGGGGGGSSSRRGLFPLRTSCCSPFRRRGSPGQAFGNAAAAARGSAEGIMAAATEGETQA